MSKSIDAMIDDVIRCEGGIVDHPTDRGGPTNFGITQRTLTRYLGHKTTKHDVCTLSHELAAEIDRRAYYLEPRLDTLPAFLFDSAGNHGPRRAMRFLPWKRMTSNLNQRSSGPWPLSPLPSARRHSQKTASWKPGYGIRKPEAAS